MRSYDEIFDIAAERHGGTAALNAKLTPALSPEKLAKIPGDRWLSQFTKSIFQAGFSWKVIDAKWDGFEALFHGFDLAACAFMDEAEFDAILSDARVVRNGAKLATVRENASLLLRMEEDGGPGAVIGGWPSSDYIGLLQTLKNDGARLGGTTGPYALRFMGRDGFILSQDVTTRLIAEGVIDKPATSKGAQRAVQSAFNDWMEQSGRGLTEISRTLAMSV